MRRQLALAELAKLVEVTKADLVNGSKQRESLLYKLKLGIFARCLILFLDAKFRISQFAAIFITNYEFWKKMWNELN